MQKTVSMSLDSSDTLSAAKNGKTVIDNECNSLSRKEELSEPERRDVPWVYMFTHRMKVNSVNEALKERFDTFIHKSVVYSHKSKGIHKEEQQTISGLIFVHGNPGDVQDFLSERFYGIHLVNDYSTRCTARIPDMEMKAFMQMSGAKGRQVRFLLHSLDHYSTGKTLIRIISGDLKGCEGYIVRIHRDRCLVTSIGNMTVAISGVCKDSFVNAEEYVHEKKTQEYNSPGSGETGMHLSPLQSEIDQNFFNPQNEIDAMAIAKSMDKWSARSRSLYGSGALAEAAEICVYVLEQIGSRFPAGYFLSETIGITSVCRSFEELLREILVSDKTSDEVKERITVALESLILRYPKLPLAFKEKFAK